MNDSMIESKQSFCGVLLAGGKSSRMGENKALLTFGGRTFLDIQLEKLCKIGASEVLVSGDPKTLESFVNNFKSDVNIRIIPDKVSNKGPLGGLYSCFTETDHNSAIVIGIDTPLVTISTLSKIIACHFECKKDATVLTAASSIEPLIAAYSTGTHTVIKELIDNDRLSIRPLLDRVDTYYLEFDGMESELFNCNLPEDYQTLPILPI